MKETVFTILGSSAGTGVPSFFCGCCACREAGNDPAAAARRLLLRMAARYSSTPLRTFADSYSEKGSKRSIRFS